MAFEGMDPVVVKDISAKMDTQVKALESVLTVIQGQVDRARSAWQGPAASTFESSWNSRHKPSLVDAHDQLSTMSALLKSEATAQTVTSDEISGPGGGSGALPGSGGPGGSEGPGGDKKDDEGLLPTKWNDWVGQSGFVLGLGGLGAESLALAKLGLSEGKLAAGSLSNTIAKSQAAKVLENMVKEGSLTQAQADKQLADIAKDGSAGLEDATKSVTEALDTAGSKAGLPATKLGENLGKGFAGLAVAGDLLTFWKPGATGVQALYNRVAAGGNILGTATPYVYDAVTKTGEKVATDVAVDAATDAAVDTGLLAANASLDWVPVAGQVLAVGTAAYLAYEQIPWVKTGVNDAVKGVWDGYKWVNNEEYKLAGDAVKGLASAGDTALHGVESAGSTAVHGLESAGSSVKNVASSGWHKATGWL